MESIAICRKVVDGPFVFPNLKTSCERCQEEVFVEAGLEEENHFFCFDCAASQYPAIVLFVELPPDEYGRRSTNKTVGEVASKGDWHRTGVWHNAKWAFANQEQ